MAVPQFNLQHQTYRYCDHSNRRSFFLPKIPSHFTINAKLRFRNSIKPPKIRCKFLYIPNSASEDDFLAPNIQKIGGKEGGDVQIEFIDNCKRWVLCIRSVLPSGSWWALSDSNEVGSTTKAAKPVTLLLALRRIWALVSDDRWVIYPALASLTIAALATISMPNLLAASVFSAQSGETALFYRNSQLLLLLCVISGICRKSFTTSLPT